MGIDEFFNIFLEELKSNPDLRSYYRFLNDKNLFEFRKAYFTQRLNYIDKEVRNSNGKIFDVGCGYGTTGIFLALNGYKVFGSTLEFYYAHIMKRFEFWKNHGYSGGFEVAYENLFDSPPAADSFGVVIAQDVLHHLEPLDEAMDILSNCLTSGGKLIACEENGSNLINNTRLFLKRGNKKVIEVYDEKLGKSFLLGNENIRSLKRWTRELIDKKLAIRDDSIEYIRFYFPPRYKRKPVPDLINKEQIIWRKNPLLKEYFFHGVNFTAEKL